MLTPLQRSAIAEAQRSQTIRAAAIIARRPVVIRKNNAAKRIQSVVRRISAKRIANRASNKQIPGQISALENNNYTGLPKELTKLVSDYLRKAAGKTKKASKNKKGNDRSHKTKTRTSGKKNKKR